MDISSIIESVTQTMDSAKTPANILPPLLLRCTSLFRSGLSAYRIASAAIQNNGAIGIPTGPNTDGSSNLINAYTYSIVKSVVEAIKHDATVQVAVPAFSLLIQAQGGNAGGPVVVTGTNLLDSIATGILQ